MSARPSRALCIFHGGHARHERDETPPKDRMAITDRVAGYDEKLVRSALEHELERGGQAYFVHNRGRPFMKSPPSYRRCCRARAVIVGQGQIPEGELEMMFAFVRHDADILVATPIIENGLDIPLCNTSSSIARTVTACLSFTSCADRRPVKPQAYAYLLVPGEQELTPVARRRLPRLKGFSDLGAGFKIAARSGTARRRQRCWRRAKRAHDAVGFEITGMAGTAHP